MLPWGHLAVGYLLYSPLVHAWQRRRPEGVAVVVLAVATQLPDLIDKPLSWQFGLFPQGYSVAHSVFVAVPVGLTVLAVAARRGRPTVGVAFTVGYWSHLAADVFIAALFRNPYALDRVLWPLVTLPSYEHSTPPVQRVLGYILAYAEAVLASGDLTLLFVYFGPVFAAFFLWLADGAPGFPRPQSLRSSR